jgi:hypothetical protein
MCVKIDATIARTIYPPATARTIRYLDESIAPDLFEISARNDVGRTVGKNLRRRDERGAEMYDRPGWRGRLDRLDDVPGAAERECLVSL